MTTPHRGESEHATPRTDLVLGIDGGGTATCAVLADRYTGAVLGRGTAGPSNIQAVGVGAGLNALDLAIDHAFETAGVPRTSVAAACLGLAGIDWDGGADVIRSWATRVDLSAVYSVENDATLLIAAGTPDGWGLAVVCGTGSIAFTRTPTGEIGRCGGWGYVLGDEGSGYQITLAALRAACRAHDRCGPGTVLVQRLLTWMKLPNPPALIDAVYRGPWDRAAIAGLAPIVMQAAADGDAVAQDILKRESREPAHSAAGAVRNNGLPATGVPVALTGGVILESEPYRKAFLSALRADGVTPGSVQLVDDPALGAIVLARQLCGTVDGA